MFIPDLIRKLEKLNREVGARPVEFSDYSPHGETLPVGKLDYKDGRVILSEEDGRQPDGSLLKDSLSPTAQNARHLLQEYKQDIVIILSMNFKTQDLAWASYGSTIKFSDLAKKLGEMIWQFARQILEKSEKKKS